MRLKLLILCSILAVGGSPISGQSPDGRTGTLVVLNKSAASATFIDVASGETVATLPTGQGPHELAITSDGRWAVSTDYSGGNSLTVFDVEDLSVERTIDLGSYPRPHGAFFLPGDSIMAITSEASQNVVLVNPLRGEVVRVIATGAGGSHMVAVTGDGATLYTGNMQAGTVSRLDVATARRTGTFNVPGTPEAITVSRDGAEVWVGSNAEGLVSVVDTESGNIISSLSGFEWPYRILIVEDRELVVIPDMGRHVVRFVDYGDRTDIETLSLPGEGPQGVALTPDQGTVFLSLSQSGEIAVIDLATRQIVRRIDSGPSPDGIGWSPLVHRR
jgi:YVTN family beta-propeller protein